MNNENPTKNAVGYNEPNVQVYKANTSVKGDM